MGIGVLELENQEFCYTTSKFSCDITITFDFQYFLT